MKILALNLMLAVFTLVQPCLATDLPGALEGQWILVKQTYGQGDHNLAGSERPVRMEINLSQGAPQVRIWAGENQADQLPWPAWVADGGPRPLTVLERVLDPAAGLLRARYRITPPDSDGEDDFFVEVDENYKVVREGTNDVMKGDLIVRFIRQGEPRGSYVLHRRFERVAP